MIDVATLAAALALVKASGGGGSGEPGFSPTVEIAEVEGGTQVTITDVNGPQTFTVLNGTNGTNGVNGQDGQDGVSPVLSIGEVTTLAAGSQATASLGGTAANPTLNLGIPQGAQGAQGAPGLDAPQIDDTQITTTNPWSSMQIVNTLCPPFTVSGATVQCTPVANYPLGVQVEITPTQEGTGDPSPENVRPIVGWDAVNIHQSNGDQDNTYTVQLGQTVYGGTLDVGTGVGSEEWFTAILTGNETWNAWGANYPNSFFTDIEGHKNLANDAINVFCSNFSFDIMDGRYTPYHFFSQNPGAFPDRVRLCFTFDETVTNIDLAKQWISAQYTSGTPVTICYRLATPTPIQATGGQSIPALSGTNTLFADAGDITVTGASDPIATITALQNRVSALESAALN